MSLCRLNEILIIIVLLKIQKIMKSYIEQHKDRFRNELLEWLRMPSVSADPAFKDDVLRAAAFAADRLKDAGADQVEIIATPGYPVVYGEKIVDPKKPTVLVYGHYDVQPADPYELWDSPPFEPVIKKTERHPDGAIYARGACDDKGQVYMHIKAFEVMMQTGNLDCNIKFMIEGEEEVGSSNLNPFLEKFRDKLKADVVLVSDTSMVANDCPSVTVGLRGLSYLEVEVTGANRDLHSGVYGGAVANPINTLAMMIASLKDANNRITIPGFYDAVREFSADERAEMAKVPFSI
jgi:acetylornithine deacetylase/succinyl-diaminopimelate desuccinylase-like protein